MHPPEAPNEPCGFRRSVPAESARSSRGGAGASPRMPHVAIRRRLLGRGAGGRSFSIASSVSGSRSMEVLKELVQLEENGAQIAALGMLDHEDHQIVQGSGPTAVTTAGSEVGRDGATDLE